MPQSGVAPRNAISGGDRLRVKRQGSAVHGTAGWPGALRGPARRCTRSPESLQSRPGAPRMSKPVRCAGHVHGRLSEDSDDRAAQPKTLRGRWCGRPIAHRGALQPEPPACRSGHREGAGVLLCPRLRHCGGSESGDVSLSPGEPARPAPAPGLCHLDLSAVDVSGCRCDRAGILLLAGGSVGTIRLLDAVKAVYASDGWGGKPEHPRTGLCRLPARLGERMDRGGHRVL